ncbi:hypothetical protein JMN32_09860 [Fulvivirga sp. 29W222]|uniref:Uncharacterized protein n=1 Tax=Fulvivirga marina TaxID=2494733 RepID=A0A937FY59_9BACT|nr:hypothetical protein [Fulvivirga marina]MBL6446616.1 hypothetical protein [Fulvivirga marina]
MNCIKCNAEVPERNINIHEDIVICDACGIKFSPSDTVKNYSKGPVDLTNPPKGIKVTKTAGNLMVIINIRSWTSVFWIFFSAILSVVFVLLTMTFKMSEMALHIIGVAVALIFVWVQTLLKMFGRIELKFDNHIGHFFIGVGNLGLKKSFLWRDIRSMEDELLQRKRLLDLDGEFASRTLVLRGIKNISFMVALNQDKRNYLKTLILPFIINAKDRE